MVLKIICSISALFFAPIILEASQLRQDLIYCLQNTQPACYDCPFEISNLPQDHCLYEREMDHAVERGEITKAEAEAKKHEAKLKMLQIISQYQNQNYDLPLPDPRTQAIQNVLQSETTSSYGVLAKGIAGAMLARESREDD